MTAETKAVTEQGSLLDAAEYERRFKAHIVKTLCPWTVEDATKAAQGEWDAVSIEEHKSGGYENDPEGAADEEMSYWSDGV